MKHVTLQRLPDDPLCLRASIGGTKEEGYYCMFRGDQDKVRAMLETVLLVLKNAPQLEIESEN
jgi:hypothetical protein